jgi:octaprenyl-diphosphate synthase
VSITELNAITDRIESEKITLDVLRSPVIKELKAFRTFFKDELKTNEFLLDQMVQYLLKMKGKELRPILVLYAARLCGGINERTYRAATMIELLHTATLIHDDVVDEADQRRGFLSFNQTFKNKASILFGDFLLAKGLLVSLNSDEFELLKIMSKAVKAMSEGELRQLKASKLQNMTSEKYFDIIRDKTASLLAACCESGANTATTDKEIVLRMSEIGLNMGIAFQIRDDMFDYDASKTGKPSGNDIMERKITLPFIHALEQCSMIERNRWKKKYRKKGKIRQEVDEIIAFVLEKGGLEHANSVMVDYSKKALDLLDTFPDSEAKTDMHRLVAYITTRKK